MELPEQLIRLYTFADDLVLDPFLGSGSTLVAAARLGRRYVGYDLDPDYVALARRRVAEVDVARRRDFTIEAARGQGGAAARRRVLAEAGFVITARKHRVAKTGVTIDFVATDDDGTTWFFDVGGPFTTYRGGLSRTDAVWKALGRASAIRGRVADVPLVLLTTSLPRRPSEGLTALRAAGPDAFFDAIELPSPDDRERLERYAKGGFTNDPQPGFWTPHDLAGRRR